MSRIGIIIWMCMGAFALGLVILTANRRGIYISKIWYMVALILGPIFFCFVIPLWLGKWGKK